MSRDPIFLIGYILDQILGLPGLLIFGLLGSIGIALLVVRMRVAKSSFPEKALSGNGLMLPLFIQPGPSDALVRSLLTVAGQGRPAG